MSVTMKLPAWGRKGIYASLFTGRTWLLMSVLIVGFVSTSMAQTAVTVQIEEFMVRLSSESSAPEEGSITVYPNPATDRVTITPSAGTQVDHLEIVAVGSGTTVFSTSVLAPVSYQVSLAVGSYLFKIENNLGQLLQEQIVIQGAP